MTKKKLRHTISGLFLLTLMKGFIFAQIAGKLINLEWKPVDNAAGYSVQIKNDHDIVVVKKKLDQNKIEVRLTPGEFYFRIGVLNKFRKVAVWSDWARVDVKKPILPSIKSVEPAIINNKTTVQKIILRGENLFQFTKINVKIDKKELPIQKKEFINSETMAFSIDASKASPGSYSIILTNPGNKLFQKDNVFSIDAPPKMMALKKPGVDYFSVVLGPQLLVFNKQNLNSILRLNKAFSADLVFDYLERYSIKPGLRIGYFTFQSRKEFDLKLTGYRFDGFLSYSIFRKYNFELNFSIGGGISSIDLSSSYTGKPGQFEKFREGNIFAGLDVRYQIFPFLSITGGAEYLRLQDQFGGISFIVPRLGIISTF